MVLNGKWFMKFKNCEHKIKLELKIGMGSLAPAVKCFLRRTKKFGKKYRVGMHTADCNMEYQEH